jgi:hypothetical protein
MARKYGQDKQSLLNAYERYLEQINRDLDYIEEHDPDSVVLERWRGYFQHITTPDPNYNALRKAVSQIRKLAESGIFSPEGQERSKAATIHRLKELGVEGVNRRNFNSVIRFLDDARARGLAAVFPSTQLIEAIVTAKKKGLSKREIQENIERWERDYARPYKKDGRLVEVITPRPIKIHVKRRKKAK